ncbi:MAG: hypothetical protein EBY31_08465, partial [Flavobacteriia bacterium]|nr:hypothetical protein [Flavobacteriia bacterium]
SGGGYFKIINQSIPAALKNLKYTENEIDAIVKHAKGHGTFAGAPFINHQTLSEKGFIAEELKKLDQAVESAFEIGFVFNAYTLGEECLQRLGFQPEQYYAPDFNLLEELGLNVTHTNFHLPLRIRGILNPSNVVFDASESSQEVSGMLMTFPLLNNPSSLKIISPVSQPYIEMTLDSMANFGIQLEKKNAEFYFPGKQHYTGNTYEIEGDWSGAATHIVGAVISGKLQLSGLNPTSKQADRAILEVLKSAGCDFYFEDSILYLNNNQKIKPFSFDILNCPDLFPVLAILACAANGCSKISGIHRLLNKESNRLTSVQEMLLRFGVESSVENDTIFIHGTGKVKATEIFSYNDHRIVMGAAIAATISDGPICIQNPEAIQKSYPTFFEVLLA